MASSYPPQLEPGASVSTTEIFDPALVNQLDVNSDEFKEFLNKLTRVVNDIKLLLDLKISGYFPVTEFLTGKLMFPNPLLTSSTPQTPIYRNGFIKVIDFGTLPDNGIKSVPHEIEVNDSYTFFQMYGASSIPGTSFVSIPNQDIKLTADAVNVTVQTFSAYVGYTTTYIILEYIKS